MLARRAGVPVVAAAVFGALVATPALADVSVSPTSAVQGSGENVTFHVTNSGTQPIGTVRLTLPADTPVAEVYPLSVDDWAPKIEMRTLSTSLATIHGDTTTSQATSAITWIAMPGLALAPGKATDLTIAIGPLPTLSSMRFTLVTTYTDGKTGPAMSPAVLPLTPAAPGQVANPHAGHEGATATQAAAASDPNAAAEDAEFAKAVADATRGPSVLSIAGWIVAALALLGGVAMMLRSRHRAEEDDEPEDEDAKTPPAKKPSAEVAEKEPVAAGKWSFKG